MKIKVTTVEEIEMDIKYPYYSRFKKFMYFKVISAETQIKVTNGLETLISIGYVTSTPFSSDMEECTEADFNEVFNECVERLKRINHAE